MEVNTSPLLSEALVSSSTSLRGETNGENPEIPPCRYLSSQDPEQILVLVSILDPRSHPVCRREEKSETTSLVKQDKDPNTGSVVLYIWHH